MLQRGVMLLIAALTINCGATEWAVEAAPIYQTGPCAVAQYQWGVYGWGFYDCYGNPVGAGYYNGINQFNYGPRIVIRPTNAGRSSNGGGGRTVVSSTPRGAVGGSNQGASKEIQRVKKSGAELFFQNCAVCHLNGVAGAPHPNEMKLSLKTVKNGSGAMPSFSHLTDEEIKSIFNYINKLKK